MVEFNSCIFYTGTGIGILYNIAMFIWLYIYPTSIIYPYLYDQVGDYAYCAASMHAALAVLSVIKLVVGKMRKGLVLMQVLSIGVGAANCSFHILIAARKIGWFIVFASIQWALMFWYTASIALPMKSAKLGDTIKSAVHCCDVDPPKVK